ncbi:MAG: hypothetical protein ACJ765_02140 [Chloroflexota bacterium]
MIRAIQLIGIAVGSFVIAALAMSLVGWFLPPLLGAWTPTVGTIILGGLIFQDIVRRDTAGRDLPKAS